jgi:hypothetical protein
MNYLVGIDQVIYSDKIETTFKFLPKSKFCKKRKQDEKQHEGKSCVGNNPVCPGVIPFLREKEQVK